MKTRLHTFETNSSSAHTMIIMNQEKITTDEEINLYISTIHKKLKSKDGSFYFPISVGNGFDSTFEILYKWYEKVNYLVASLQSEYEEDIINALKTRIPNLKGFALTVCDKDGFIEEHIEKYTDSLCVYDPKYNDDDLFGTVDHQSNDMAENILTCLKEQEQYKGKSNVDILAEIIFSNNFIIVTDSDGDPTFDRLFVNNFFQDALNSSKIYKEQYYYDKTTGKSTITPMFIDASEFIKGYNAE